MSVSTLHGEDSGLAAQQWQARVDLAAAHRMAVMPNESGTTPKLPPTPK